MAPWKQDKDLLSRDDPYDPDMTVGEALDQGLIAVIDSGQIGRDYHEQCDHAGPFDIDNKDFSGAYRCTRVKGHQGVHAFVVRFGFSFQERRSAFRADRQQGVDRHSDHSGVLPSLRETEEAMKRLEQATEAAAKTEVQIPPFTKSDEDKALDRLDSMVYGPMKGTSKRQKFRDNNVGKVRGR